MIRQGGLDNTSYEDVVTQVHAHLRNTVNNPGAPTIESSMKIFDDKLNQITSYLNSRNNKNKTNYKSTLPQITREKIRKKSAFSKQRNYLRKNNNRFNNQHSNRSTSFKRTIRTCFNCCKHGHFARNCYQQNNRKNRYTRNNRWNNNKNYRNNRNSNNQQEDSYILKAVNNIQDDIKTVLGTKTVYDDPFTEEKLNSMIIPEDEIMTITFDTGFSPTQEKLFSAADMDWDDDMLNTQDMDINKPPTFKVCVDSGATSHFFDTKSYFENLHDIAPRTVSVGKRDTQYTINKAGIVIAYWSKQEKE